MKAMNNLADDINILGSFCGIRDVPILNKEELIKKYHIEQADVMVLFGGCIIMGGEVLADAMLNKVAKRYIIVGGRGHTTESLVKEFHKRFIDFEDFEMTEAELFSMYIQRSYGLLPDYIEKESTNCGNNITNLLKLFEDNHISSESIIMVQDSTMQRRMSLTMEKYAPQKSVINYACYEADVTHNENGELMFSEEISGMWCVERYISLLLGEISRMTDDKNGYGPNGANYIAHTDIPKEVLEAYTRILATKRYCARGKK